MIGFWLVSFCIRYFIQCQNQFFSEIMIKQSFLRNYNLSKIQLQAEEQKKKLQVFYSRQVEKIIKQRRHMNRELSREMLCKQHKQEKQRIKQRIQELKEIRYSEDKQSLRRTTNRKQEQIEQPLSIEQKKKVHLSISDLELKSCHTSVDSNHQSLKITITPNISFHKRMLHSIMRKLKQENGFQLEDQDGKHQSPIQKLKKMKYKTNPSFHQSLEHFNFDQKKSIPAKLLKKIRIKRTQTSNIELNKCTLQADQTKCILTSPKFSLNLLKELNSKGIIKRQTSYEPE